MIVKTIAVATLMYGAGAFAAHASIQVGFSPEGSARALVLDLINHAQHNIDMMVYSFQSTNIVQVLVNAEKRGVMVQAIIDKRQNQGRVNQKAIAFATANGIGAQLGGHCHTQHGKVVIIDGNMSGAGPFNFAKSAEFVNSENVLVTRDKPAAVAQHQIHFDNRWRIAYQSG